MDNWGRTPLGDRAATGEGACRALSLRGGRPEDRSITSSGSLVKGSIKIIKIRAQVSRRQASKQASVTGKGPQAKKCRCWQIKIQPPAQRGGQGIQVGDQKGLPHQYNKTYLFGCPEA